MTPFRLYALLDRLIRPRSYVAKFFVVAFLSVHMPLLAIACYALVDTQRMTLGIGLTILIISTVVGTLISLIAFWHLLAPILAVGQALRAYLKDGTPPSLPTHFQDEVGMLLRDTRYVLHTLHHQRIQLKERANRDHLTGLLNRRAAEHILQERIAAYRLLPYRGFCLGLLDIDHFKHINDRYGHGIGDAVLQEVSVILANTLRAQDWAARWGGEEFVVCIDGSPEGAIVALERVRQYVANHHFAENDISISLTLSIGYSEVQHSDHIDDLVRRADHALYQAKDHGRNCVLYAANVDTPFTASTRVMAAETPEA